MLRPQAPGVAAAILSLMGLVGCRDWDRFEPTAAGGGGGAASTGNASNGSNGSNGSSGSGTGSTGGGGVGGSGGGGTGGSTCGTIDILSDDFEAGALDWRWEHYEDPGTYTFDAGDLVISLPASDFYTQLNSTAAFDFRGRTMIVELVPPLPLVHFWFNVARDTDNYLEIAFAPDGLIHYNHEVDGAFSTFAGEALDPEEYRFWRFRESDGTVYFDLSTDGVAWMERTSYDISSLFDPAVTSVYLGAGSDGTGSTEEVRVARVYSGEPSALGPCPATSLTDDFEDASAASVWDDRWDGSQCWVDESGGLLNFSCDPGADDDAGYFSSSVFDMTSSSLSIELASPPEPGTDSFLDLMIARPEEDTLLAFHLHADEIEMYLAIDGNWIQVEVTPFDPEADRFLRLREDGGTFYFERSPDNAAYEVLHSLTVPFDLTAVQVGLIGGAEGGNPMAASASVDNLNLGP